jgi:endonuclease/exonuclease/phosphatase (EEP) superfamily protein YafD
MEKKMLGSALKRALTARIPFSAYIAAGAFLALFCSLIGYLGRFHWFLDLFAHFKIQYFLLAGGCCAVSAVDFHLARRKRRMVDKNAENGAETAGDNGGGKRKMARVALAAGLLALVLNAVEIVPLYFFPSNNAPSTSNRLHLLHINVNTENSRYGDVERYVLSCDPDILLLVEVDSNWLANIPRITRKYPFKIADTRSDNFGIALFAKKKPLDAKLLAIGDTNYGIKCVEWKFSFDGADMTLLGLHTLPPIGRVGSNERNAMLAEIAETARKAEKNGSEVIVLGDLNITPWSSFFKRLERDARLRDARRGFGVNPSWPTVALLRPLLIPIDHCLVSEGINVVDFRTGMDVGSDHYPLEVELESRGRQSPHIRVTP